jgi:hypothetical protein
MRLAFSLLVLGLLCAAPLHARESVLSATAEIGGRNLVLNGESTRTVWGFEVYKIRLYLPETMRDADQILGSKGQAKRIEIVMVRSVDEEQFSYTVQQSIDNNFSDEEKQRFSVQLSEFLGCFNNGADLEPGNVITIDYIPAEGTVVKLDGRTLDTIPGADFYHALLRLWIGKPLQKSIKDGLVGTPG